MLKILGKLLSRTFNFIEQILITTYKSILNFGISLFIMSMFITMVETIIDQYPSSPSLNPFSIIEGGARKTVEILGGVVDIIFGG